ncbi:MAG: S8 family serine peptidase [Solirubrobacteraceae bacterium]
MRRAENRVPAMLWGAVVLCTALALGAPRAAGAATVSPLPESNYVATPACPPPTPGRATCLALELRPRTLAARELKHPIGMSRSAPIASPTALDGVFGLSPEDLRSAYFPGEKPEAPDPQTIALVDAYNDYHAEADLNVYDQELALPELGRPEPTKCATTGTQSGCFEQVNQRGEKTKLPFPENEAEEKSEEALCVNEEPTETSTEATEKAEVCHQLKEAEGWSVDISPDIEMAHAIGHNCKILLVEADSPSYEGLEEAEKTAVGLGANEVSNSWGGLAPIEPDSAQESAQLNAALAAFDYPKTVITAAAGDDGYLNWTEADEVERSKQECLEQAKSRAAREACEKIVYSDSANYPASSPYVVAVGGTKLTMSNGVRQSESVWGENPAEAEDNGAGGGGCSTYFEAAEWQLKVPDWSSVGCEGMRAVADVAADADPYTGVAVYDSKTNCEYEDSHGRFAVHWCPVGGTSVASPIVASMFALAGGSNGVAYPAETLYSHLETTSLHDVTSGGNGKCNDDYLSCSGSLNLQSPLYPLDCGEGSLACNAAPGCGSQYYDGPTGVGTPDGIAALKPGTQPPIVKRECEPNSKPSKEEVKQEEGGSAGAGPKSSEDLGGGESKEGGEPGTGGSSGSPAGSGSTGTNSTPTDTHANLAPAPLRLSALTLTASARSAVRRGKPTVSQLAFSCTLSRSVVVRVVLALEVRSGNRTHWRTLHSSLTFTAREGLNRRHLQGSTGLAPGTYRLTLTPAGGEAQSISFRAL